MSLIHSEVDDLSQKLTYLLNHMDEKGLLEDGCFTFPDGQTWYADPPWEPSMEEVKLFCEADGFGQSLSDQRVAIRTMKRIKERGFDPVPKRLEDVAKASGYLDHLHDELERLRAENARKVEPVTEEQVREAAKAVGIPYSIGVKMVLRRLCVMAPSSEQRVVHEPGCMALPTDNPECDCRFPYPLSDTTEGDDREG